MKNAFAIVTLSGLLTACAVAPSAPGEVAPTLASAPVEVVAPSAAVPSAQGDAESADDVDSSAGGKLPNVALSGELLYKLLRSELDFKNGNWEGPYLSQMAAAQQTRDPRLARRAAEMALAGHHPDEARAAVHLWRELAPESDDASQYFLGLTIESDHIGEVEALFQHRLRDAAPARRGVALFQIQQLLSHASDKAAASAMLERLANTYPDLLEAHLVLSQSAFGRGDTALALREAQTALVMVPNSELAVLTLAQVTQGQDAMAALLLKFLQEHPEAREVRAAHARLLLTQEKYAQARQEFLVLLEGRPDNLATLYALGSLSLQLRDAKAAESYFSKFMAVLDGHPGDERDPSKVLMTLSQLAEDRGDLAGAIAWLDKFNGADARNWFLAQLRRAQLIGKQGDVAGARQLLADLKSDDPGEQAQVLLAHAQVLRDARQEEAAFGVLEAGAQRFPANADVLYDFALTAEKTGRLEVMETSLRQVIAQAPDNHHAYNALGYSLAERNIRLPEALELIGKALTMAPDDPFIMDSMGWVQYRLGNLGQAEQLLRRAYTLRDDPEIAVHLGEVLWQEGQKADAQKMWRAAHSKDPKNDTLRSTLARLNQKL